MISNLNNYVIFHTVAKAGNISKAANQLYISQPAISKSISKLEAELGTALFSRSSKGVTLTEEGQVLYEYVERAFDSLNMGEENLKKLQGAWNRPYKDRSQHIAVQAHPSGLPEGLYKGESEHQVQHRLPLNREHHQASQKRRYRYRPDLQHRASKGDSLLSCQGDT